jgi:hypothetical protein
MGDVHAGWPKEHFYHLHIHNIVLGLGKNLHNLGRGGHRRCQKVIYPKGSCFFRYHFEAESETGTSAMAEFVQGVCTGKLHAT